MQNFNDRLLFIVDRVTGKLGFLATLLDRIVTGLAPQAAAVAQYCPQLCGYECSGVCQGGKYKYEICSYNWDGCQHGETWSNLLGCDC